MSKNNKPCGKKKKLRLASTKISDSFEQTPC